MPKELNRYFVILILMIITLPSVNSHAVEKNSNLFHDKHFAGVRIGVYSAISNEVPAPFEDDNIPTLKFTKSSAYIEFFYAHRLIKPASLEISFGVYKRGETKYSTAYGIAVQPVYLYPIFLSTKMYPFYLTKMPFHLFIQPGGCLFYGRHEKIIFDGGYYFLDQKSEIKFTYVLGAGIDFPIGKKFGLTAGYKYLPAEFGSELGGVRDYSGWTFTVGAGYIF
jgi:hypothetical protein